MTALKALIQDLPKFNDCLKGLSHEIQPASYAMIAGSILSYEGVKTNLSLTKNDENGFLKCAPRISLKGPVGPIHSCKDITDKESFKKSGINLNEDIVNDVDDDVVENYFKGSDKLEERWKYLEKLVEDSGATDITEFTGMLSMEMSRAIYARCGLSWATLATQIIKAKNVSIVNEENELTYIQKLIKRFKTEYIRGAEEGTLQQEEAFLEDMMIKNGVHISPFLMFIAEFFSTSHMCDQQTQPQ